MARKKTFLKRKRERLITQEFFAMDPDADDADPECTCHVECSHCGPRQIAETKPVNWIRTDLINKTGKPKDQGVTRQVDIEQSRLQQRGEGSSTPVCFDWRDKTKDFIVASTDVAEDIRCPTNLRIEAQCSRTFARAAHLGEELDSMLCFVQAFNANESLHVTYEQHLEIRKEYALRHGRTLPDGPSFLAQIDAQSAKLERTTQSGKTKPAKKSKLPPRKTQTIDVVLAEYEENWRAAVKVVHDVCQGITVETAALPTQPPDDLTFYSQKLPPDLPQHIRQEIQDVEFVLKEIYPIRKDITKLRDKARNILNVWLACDSTTWRYGTKHAHESPHMVLYERTRLWLAACYILWRRGEDKIHRYVHENNLTGIFSETLNKALGITIADEDSRPREWAPMMEVIKYQATPFADMLEECKVARRRFCKEEQLESGDE